MLLKQETYKQQNLLAEYCRTGIANGDIEANPQRLPHYRRLVFNVVKEALETTYPIAFKYIERKIWDEMVYNFFCLHNCQHAQVWRMPKEFYAFCRSENYSEKYKLPYLNDLLCFEWLEAEIYMMEDLEYPAYERDTKWQKHKIAINPEHRIIKLEYPVHLYKPEEAVNLKGNYFVLIYREKENGKVQFIKLSVLFAFLLENIALRQKTLEEIITAILPVFGINDLELVKTEVNKFLLDLKLRGFILGILKD